MVIMLAKTESSENIRTGRWIAISFSIYLSLLSKSNTSRRKENMSPVDDMSQKRWSHEEKIYKHESIQEEKQFGGICQKLFNFLKL